MKIVTVIVKNYRVLKEITVDWQEQLSLIIGKNNCGKTSLLSVMNKLLSESKNISVHYDDFNVDFKKEGVGRKAITRNRTLSLHSIYR